MSAQMGPLKGGYQKALAWFAKSMDTNALRTAARTASSRGGEGYAGRYAAQWATGRSLSNPAIGAGMMSDLGPARYGVGAARIGAMVAGGYLGLRAGQYGYGQARRHPYAAGIGLGLAGGYGALAMRNKWPGGAALGRGLSRARTWGQGRQLW